MNKELVLEVKNLSIKLLHKNRKIEVVDNINLEVKRGKILGIVGESGSGKSLTCMSILGLLDKRIFDVSSEMFLKDDILEPSNNKIMHKFRGKSIALILQNPISAFNPTITIGKHFEETISSHEQISKKEIEKEAIELLSKMRIKNSKRILKSYPFECSGGMLQRVMIALAISLKPDLLIADEPTTALDLTVQKEILKILKNMRKELGTSIIIVSHDLGIISSLADDIAVMYSGNVIEKGDKESILSNPTHPYTKAFFNSKPKFSKKRLEVLQGNSPSIFERKEGCKFYDRCNLAKQECESYNIESYHVDENHSVSCICFSKGESERCHC